MPKPRVEEAYSVAAHSKGPETSAGEYCFCWNIINSFLNEALQCPFEKVNQ